MTLKSDLEKLAARLLKSALEEDAKADFQLDTFKVVANYHVANQRVAKGKPPEDLGTPTFADLTRNLKSTQTGGTA